jgi:hypothetical protein
MVDPISSYTCETPYPPESDICAKGTKVIRYDLGLLAVLKTVSEFEAYISQNKRSEIQRWRQVRLSLRALEGRTVAWPYEHVTVRAFFGTFKLNIMFTTFGRRSEIIQVGGGPKPITKQRRRPITALAPYASSAEAT